MKLSLKTRGNKIRNNNNKVMIWRQTIEINSSKIIATSLPRNLKSQRSNKDKNKLILMNKIWTLEIMLFLDNQPMQIHQFKPV
jgi:hypothetical protein